MICWRCTGSRLVLRGDVGGFDWAFYGGAAFNERCHALHDSLAPESIHPVSRPFQVFHDRFGGGFQELKFVSAQAVPGGIIRDSVSTNMPAGASGDGYAGIEADTWFVDNIRTILEAAIEATIVNNEPLARINGTIIPARGARVDETVLTHGDGARDDTTAEPQVVGASQGGVTSGFGEDHLVARVDERDHGAAYTEAEDRELRECGQGNVFGGLRFVALGRKVALADAGEI